MATNQPNSAAAPRFAFSRQAEAEARAPRSAFTFEAPLVVGAVTPPAAEAETADGPPPSAPISILARSPQPLNHWYWGRIVHDLAGMKPAAPVIPLDWCHDGETNLGFLDKFAADPAVGLTVGGQLVPFQAEDRAAQVLHKGRAGVPYQGSIDWSGPGCLIEEVGEGLAVEVNGYQFEGPGVVVRQWPLSSVALCPSGYDPDTRAQFSKSDDRREELSVKTFTKGPAMKTAPDASNPTPPPADGREQFAAELQKFTARFGAEKGLKYFSDGKQFAEALDLHSVDLTEQLAARDAKIAELTQKFAALKLGETEPLSQGDGEPQKPKGAKAFANLIRIRGK
jgi:hypothetical protein